MKCFILTETEPTNSVDIENTYIFTDEAEAIKAFNEKLEEYDFDETDEDCIINREGQLNEWSYASTNCECICQAAIQGETCITLERTK